MHFYFAAIRDCVILNFVSLNEKNIVKMDGKLWLIFDSVKTGAEVKLPLSLLFEGKALTLLQKYQGKWSSFFFNKK